MQKILVIAAFLAVSLLTMAASAAEQAAKPTDPQIAHIVYTANLLDIEAAKQALQNPKTMVSATLPNKWSEIIRR